MRLAYCSALVALSALPLQGCTDLTETPKSNITPGNFYRNEAEVLGGVASVYAMTRNDGTLWGYYNISEISTDEMIVPTRGQDWFDNGRWLEIHRQTWQAASPAGLDDINRIWVDSYRGVARANVVLDALKNVTVSNQVAMEAELRTLRAFYYYLLLDTFGGVPLATDAAVIPRARVSRDSLFRFIESELLAVRLTLPLTRPATEQGRVRRGVADAILASMYLNAGVFAKNTGVSATAYNSCTGVNVAGGLSACQAAINFSDSILNSGVYTLAATWRSNFTATNRSSPENIFVAKNVAASGLGLNFPQRALHYSQFNPEPWNGFSTLAETYRAFDAADQRRQIFLNGPQVNQETGAPVCERPKTTCGAGSVPLVFTDTIGDATAARENEGTRIMKFSVDPGHVAENNGNDFTFFRLAEIYLIKAEALNEQTPGSATALNLVNTIRARVFTPPKPLVAINRAAILNERLFEFAGEAKRRQDLIRHGRYTTWTEASKNGKAPATENFRILLPIPQSQLDANPLLVQNSGY
jgi:hypothetical protein